MKICLSPQRRDDELILSKNGDVLSFNGDLFDFTELPDGATLPFGEVPCEWITGDVIRLDGEINITVIIPHGPNPSSDVAFPKTISVKTNGVIPLPTGEVDDVES